MSAQARAGSACLVPGPGLAWLCPARLGPTGIGLAQLHSTQLRPAGRGQARLVCARCRPGSRILSLPLFPVRCLKPLPLFPVCVFVRLSQKHRQKTVLQWTPPGRAKICLEGRSAGPARLGLGLLGSSWLRRLSLTWAWARRRLSLAGLRLARVVPAWFGLAQPGPARRGSAQARFSN